MSDLFSNAWMNQFKEEWNKEPELTHKLEEIAFNSTIGYGFTNNEHPTGIITVENGKVTSAGSYNGETLNWDLRAQEEIWQNWLEKGVGMTGLGVAATVGKLKFECGDYASMIKDPRMAGPFVKSFSVMSKV